MPSVVITYKNSQIHYTLSGTGAKTLLCLHGFGEHAESFELLAERLGAAYTIIAIELPFHGNTNWKDGLLFTISDLAAIIHLIEPLRGKNFSLAGYSMGGRVALHLYQHMPARIEKLILLAPDGIKINGWYRFATQTQPGNFIFHRTMQKPGLFFAVTGGLKKIGMINPGVYNYVYQYLGRKEKRIELYTIWTTMRKIRPHISRVLALIQQYKTPTVLIYGRHDKIIQYKTGERFTERANGYASLHILDCGHRLLHGKNIEGIATIIGECKFARNL